MGVVEGRGGRCYSLAGEQKQRGGEGGGGGAAAVPLGKSRK